MDDIPVTGQVVGAGRNLRRNLFALDVFALDVALIGRFGPFVGDGLLDDRPVHVDRLDLDSVDFGGVDLDLGFGGPDVVGDLVGDFPRGLYVRVLHLGGLHVRHQDLATNQKTNSFMTMSNPKITPVKTVEVMTVTAVNAIICSRVGQVTLRSS